MHCKLTYYIQTYHFEIWDKSLHFLLPVMQRRSWRYDEERTPHAEPLGHVTQKGYALDRLAQTHLVSKDTTDTLENEYLTVKSSAGNNAAVLAI